MTRWAVTVVPARALAAAMVAVGGALAVAALVAGPAGPAGAHARVTGSSPAAGEAVDQAPDAVSLVLTAKPATVEGDPLMVYAPDGRRVDTGPTRLSADRQTLTVALDTAQGLPAGDYQLAYRVVSSDTHVIFGRVTFSTLGPRPASSPEAGAAGPSGTGAQDVTIRRLGSAGGEGSGDAALGQPAQARQLAAPGPDDVRPRAVAAGAAAAALVGLAWGMRPGRRRRRREAEAAERAADAAATRSRRRRVAAAQPHDLRQDRRPPGRRPAPALPASPGTPRSPARAPAPARSAAHPTRTPSADPRGAGRPAAAAAGPRPAARSGPAAVPGAAEGWGPRPSEPRRAPGRRAG